MNWAKVEEYKSMLRSIKADSTQVEQARFANVMDYMWRHELGGGERQYLHAFCAAVAAGADGDVGGPADRIAQHAEFVIDAGDFYRRCVREFDRLRRAKPKGYAVICNGRPAEPPTLAAVVESSLRLGEMLASGQAPSANTDATFLAGNCCGSQFEQHPELGNFYKKVAAAHGLTSVTGKKYLSGLARFAGDPEAWVAGKGDVQRVLEERGWGCEGSLSVKPKNLGRKPARMKRNLKERFHAAGLPVAAN